MKKVMKVMGWICLSLWGGMSLEVKASTMTSSTTRMPAESTSVFYDIVPHEASYYFSVKQDDYVYVGTDKAGQIVINQPEAAINTCQVFKTLETMPADAAYAYQVHFYQDNQSGAKLCVANQLVAASEEALFSLLAGEPEPITGDSVSRSRFAFDQGQSAILGWLESETGGQFVELEPEDYERLVQEEVAHQAYLASRQAIIDTDREAFDKPLDSRGYVSFGYRQAGYDMLDGIHRGIDYGHPDKVGASVYSVATGRVYAVRDHGSEGYGLHVIMEYEYNNQVYRVYYAHLSEVLVQEGQDVLRGEELAKMGNTGLSTGPHLHFEVRIAPYEGYNDIDPWLVSKH